MTKKRKIAWESWNAKVEEFFTEEQEELISEEDEESDFHNLYDLVPSDIFVAQNRLIHTPIGAYPEDSLLRPSRRWDCWIAHTNFEITSSILAKIEDIEGIEALKIMGRYSFFVCVARLFDIKDVRKKIETDICNYTEQEILSDKDIKKTVNLVKKQLQSSDYWSILVSPDGEVEYISSNEMNKTYLDGLNKLIVLKNNIGGIILRGTNG
jgi:hypothetical protein